MFLSSFHSLVSMFFSGKNVKNGLFLQRVEDDRQGNETENLGALEEWQDKDRYPTGDGNKRPKHPANHS